MAGANAESSLMEVRPLSATDVHVVGAIDRSEEVDREYQVVDGELRERRPTMPVIPAWSASGSGPHTVGAEVAFCRASLEAGGRMFGAFDRGTVLGVSIAEPAFDPPAARLSFLYVSRPHRRRGVASALWRRSINVVRSLGAEVLFVSAVPTGSAVGFYLAQGCTVADPAHPALVAAEPDDVQLVLHL